VVLGLGVLGPSGRLLRRFEGTTYDLRQRWFAREPHPDIVLVLVDKTSVDWGGSERMIPFPWPRSLDATMVEFCAAAGARVLAVDVLFDQISAHGDAPVWLEGVESGPPVLLAMRPSNQGGRTTWPDQGVRLLPGAKELAARLPGPALYSAAELPLESIACCVDLLGHSGGLREEEAVIRRAQPFVGFDGQAVPMLGVGCYLASSARKKSCGILENLPPVSFTGESLRIGDRILDIDSDGACLLRYRALAVEGKRPYPVIPAREILAASMAEDSSDARSFGLEGKLVLIGQSSVGTIQDQPTPLKNVAPGTEVHATLLDNLLRGDTLRRARPPFPLLVATLLAMLAAVMASRAGSWPRILASLAVFGPIPFLLGLAFFPLGVVWPVAEPQAAVALAIVGGVVLNTATESKQRKFITGAFQRYLSPAVIERLVEDPSLLVLGGERRELTIFFSDLQGFSGISERLDPTELTSLLNDYLTDMTDIILEEGGTLDKYEGDAIIAFWNAPLDQSDHALRACRTAILCQDKLRERSAELERRAGVPLRMRIGLNTGPVVVGNMGSRSRFDYTVLGDAANLASRLEGANKRFGTSIMASETTWKRALEACPTLAGRFIGKIQVVGRKEPVPVYEPLGLCGETASEATQDLKSILALCEGAQWEDARRALEELEGDSLVESWREMVGAVARGEREGWDGVFRLNEK
jgi:adenylate cyclase